LLLKIAVMSLGTSRTQVSDLPWQLEADIRTRELSPGNRYLTAAEAGRMLGVSTSLASRAMQLLADRNVLVRRRRLGTVVGSAVSSAEQIKPGLKILPVLVPQGRDLSVHYSEELLGGIREVLPDVCVQVVRLPAQDPVGYVTQLMTQAINPAFLFGAIAVSCPREVDRCLRDLGVPAVLIGTPYPGDDSLPSVDVNHGAMGDLFIEYGLEKGCRSFALVTFDVWAPGDNLLWQGLTQALARTRLAPDTLSILSLPTEPEIIDSQVRRFLAQAESPSLLICPSRVYADACATAAESEGLRVGKEVEIVCNLYATRPGERSPFPSIRGAETYREKFTVATRLLLELAQGGSLEEPHVSLPVSLGCKETSPMQPMARP
jgi:DNA-binding LacI/PurR family transcriptional regulator